ncbi:hypothetical protein [Helicobacter pylori]|uniref:hypothetical protein n=1 Tax=Helicobacter pylori TaxID=210 RepID=UPI0018A6EB82|nr:hypothetical protein [Helicobacter pylori]
MHNNSNNNKHTSNNNKKHNNKTNNIDWGVYGAALGLLFGFLALSFKCEFPFKPKNFNGIGSSIHYQALFALALFFQVAKI